MSQLILIVDDEPGILSALSNVFHDEGFETLSTGSGVEALALYGQRSPDLVFLDIWLPDRDGLETLQAIRELDPTAAVIMMSGHGTTSTAVKSIKMGAFDYVEKPVSYDRLMETVNQALEYRQSVAADSTILDSLERTKPRVDSNFELLPPQDVPLLRRAEVPQRTIAKSTVVYGLGLHSGNRTGMAIQPLPHDSGIHFVTLPTDIHIPAFVSAVAETDYATTLADKGASIRTVEHLLSALHAYGITNLLIKVHGEIPVLDGSALEFCGTLEEAGIRDQDRPRR
ncbi:MAG: UDP-3-O-acyl-N-acetylglucosamine deacetylase, partial [Acidobacteriota bacterium]